MEVIIHFLYPLTNQTSRLWPSGLNLPCICNLVNFMTYLRTVFFASWSSQ